ncbi:MAG: response regulator, partial [Nitrososphaeraceae archaeon]
MTKPPLLGNSNLESNYGCLDVESLEKDHISFTSIQNKRILIIDDNSDIAFTLRIGLENNDANMEVYSYDNPINALIDFKPNFYDLLLIDVNMPLMDGFEL